MKKGLTFILMMAVSPLAMGAGTSGAQFLKLGAGARAAGMGDAFSSVADDVNATYWNPAGLTQIESPEVSLMHESHLIETQYQTFSAALPFEKNAVGIALYRMDYGSMDAYSAADVKTGTFDAGSMALGLTWSRKINDVFTFGVTGKYIQESIEAEKASAFAGDFGTLSTFNRFNFSLSIHNLGSKIKFVKDAEDLPATVRAGLSRKFIQEKLLISLDYSKPNDNNGTLHLGGEYKIATLLDLRAGYQVTPGNELDVDGLTNITGGMGLNMGRLTLDYAFVPFGELGDTHRISLLFRFQKK